MAFRVCQRAQQASVGWVELMSCSNSREQERTAGLKDAHFFYFLSTRIVPTISLITAQCPRAELRLTVTSCKEGLQGFKHLLTPLFFGVGVTHSQ